MIRRAVVSMLVVAVALAMLPAPPAASSGDQWDPGAGSHSSTLRDEVAAVAESSEPTVGGGGHSLQTSHPPCVESSHTDPADVTYLDAAEFGLFLDCETGAWVFAIITYDSWVDADLDWVDIAIDADEDPSTGCGGFEWLVLGFYDVDLGLIAGVVSTPVCDSGSWTVTEEAGIARTASDDIGLVFPHSGVGSPSVVRWAGEITSYWSELIDFVPDSSWVTNTVPGSVGDACEPSQTAAGEGRWFVVSDDGPGAAAALLGAGLGGVVHRGGGVVSFTGAAGLARSALQAASSDLPIHPDVPRPFLAEPPDDPGYVEQWSLPAIYAEEAWELAVPDPSVVIAVVDSGVDANHGDLSGRLLPGWDTTTGAPLAGGNTDADNHGTPVAGVVTATTGNGLDVASIGRELSVLPIKVNQDVSSFVAGIRRAADEGAAVINVSAGSVCPSSPEADAVAHAQEQGAVVVAAVGNTGVDEAVYPAAYPGVIGVGATRHDGTVASYSNRGAHVDITAPGGAGDGVAEHQVLVLGSGGGTRTVDGTSFSAPLVAGTLGLMLSANPQLPPDQAGDLVLASAVDAGPTGRDDQYGEGVLDAAAAVQSAIDAVSVSRLWGANRYDTAVAISQDAFPTTGSAAAAVLSRGDAYADALAGTPLAVEQGGPLLLVKPTGLDSRTEAELRRAVPTGSPVFILGGPSAVPSSADDRLRELGYSPIRYAGANRYETAVVVAREGLSNPGTALLTSGRSFADALVAGAASPAAGAAVLLTKGTIVPQATQAWLDNHPGTELVAVGGKAAQAVPDATALVGSTRYKTARVVADHFFTEPAAVGIASGTSFPDALSGGAHVASLGGPLLLTRQDRLPVATDNYLASNRSSLLAAFLYGGTAVVDASVASAVRQRLS